MSLFRDTLRPPAILSDEAVERYLKAIRAEIGPDPLFRRRLRGEVMNRYVAAREGIDAAPRRRAMGKLGRAVLYASFTLALSATSVLAASQEALPGDLLYPLKRQVETLRREVLPAHLDHDLAAYELAERLDELSRLAEVGDWPRVASTAAVVAADYETYLTEADAAGLVADDRYLTVLAALLERLPEPAQDAVQAMLDRAPSRGSGAPRANGPAGSGNAVDGTSGRAGTPAAPSGNGNGPSAAGEDDRAQKPTRSPKPEPTPRASRGPDGDGGPSSAGGHQRTPSSSDGDDQPVDED